MIKGLDKMIVCQVMDLSNHCKRMTLKFYGLTTATAWMRGMYHVTLGSGACFGISLNHFECACLTLPKKLNY